LNRDYAYLKWILAVLWTVFILYGLMLEPSEPPRFPWLVKPGVDKLIHAILFCVEAGLLAWGPLRNKNWISIIWCFLFGGGLELIQHFWINGRFGQPMDLVADMVGAVLGIWLTTRLLKKYNGVCGK
jgi:VanZ family protein